MVLLGVPVADRLLAPLAQAVHVGGQELAAGKPALPMNLLSTFSSPLFVTYMGAPASDLRADLQFSDEVDTVRTEVLSRMSDDDRLTDVRVFANVLYEAESDAGVDTLRVEVGDYSRGTVEFTDGGPPGPGEIALSVLNADKYQVTTGDALTVRDGAEPMTLAVSGVYQDVTSGGHTAKMHGEVTTGAAGYVIYANAVQGADPAAVAAQYRERFPTASVIPMRDYVQQTLSYVTSAFGNAAILSFVLGLAVAALITGLFLKLRLTRDRQKMGVLSAIGFGIGEIVGQVRGKTVLAVVVGTSLGVAFSATAGESIVGAFIAMAGLGIADLTFIPNAWFVYAAYPLLLIVAGYLGAVALTARLRKTDRSLWLRG
jgi:putative ABC transport system permease protein